MTRFITTSALLLSLALSAWTPGQASAQRVATCVDVRASSLSRPDLEALSELVRTEVDRHRTHVSADADCASHLLVELIALEGHRYLTARINRQVPDRVEVEDTLEAAASELLTIVLHSDPVRLRRPEQDAGLSGALHRLRSQGHTLWELELAETSLYVDHRFFGLPTAALHYRRELARFSLGLRVSLAARTSPEPPTLAPVAFVNLAFEMRYHASADADTSGYIGGQLGLEHQWLHGPLHSAPNSSDSANSTGLALGLRLGVELFRTTTTRLDFFTLLSAPLFLSKDEVHDVVKSWIPTVTLGVGLGL